MAWCDNNALDYLFGLAGNKALPRLADETADDIPKCKSAVLHHNTLPGDDFDIKIFLRCRANYNSTIPRFMTSMAAVILLLASIFLITFFMWKLTVFTDIPRIFPISHDDFPFAVHRMHSFSLGERLEVLSMPVALANSATLR